MARADVGQFSQIWSDVIRCGPMRSDVVISHTDLVVGLVGGMRVGIKGHAISASITIPCNSSTSTVHVYHATSCANVSFRTFSCKYINAVVKDCKRLPLLVECSGAAMLSNAGIIFSLHRRSQGRCTGAGKCFGVIYRDKLYVHPPGRTRSQIFAGRGRVGEWV